MIKYSISVIKIFTQCSQMLERSILWLAVTQPNDYFYIKNAQYFVGAAIKRCKGQ